LRQIGPVIRLNLVKVFTDKNSMKIASVLALCALVILTLGQACGPAFAPMSNENGSLSSSAFLSEAERAECAALSTKPNITSISSLVAYLNALPRPVKLHCVLAELPRPLYVQAGSSASSAQPSPGPRDPRIFIKLQNMILAVVTDGTAKNTLEVSQFQSGSQWERAEFVFPISASTLTEADGLEHIRFNSGTTCGLCHQNETGSRTLGSSPVFKSDILKFVSSERVPISDLKIEAEACRTQGDSSDRCLLFKSLFDLGSVLPTEL